MSFISLHVGAGSFEECDLKELKKVCKLACDEGMKVMKEGGNASEAIAVSISVLEDCPLTNAGKGSCLTYQGTVECDASIMNDRGDFASVGAVSGVCNPIKLAHQLMVHQSNGLLSLGRIPPMCLCGEGAYHWAKENGVPVCDNDILITDKSKEIYLDHMDMLKNTEQKLEEKEEKEEEPCRKKQKYQKEGRGGEVRLDTVGAVCYDGVLLAAGSSSGGISLKHLGRIGQAGVYGCGCWTDHSTKIASSVSGVGEYLIKSQLAKELSLLLQGGHTIQEAFKKSFIDNPLLKGCHPKLAGAIVLHIAPPNGSIELSWVHSTDSMLIGYNNNGNNSKVILSRLGEEGSSMNTLITAGWLCFN